MASSRDRDARPAGQERAFLLREMSKRILKARAKKGWNQSEFARNAALHMPDKKFGRDSISKYEKGSNLPGPLHLLAMAQALGVEPDDLVPDSKAIALSTPVTGFELRTVGDGTMFIRMNQAVPTGDAMRILDIIEKGKRR